MKRMVDSSEQKAVPRDLLEKEIRANYSAFVKMRFDKIEKGRFAILKDGKLVEVMVSKNDAHKMARLLFPEGIYSIQEIDPEPLDMGFMNHALR